MDGRRVMRRQLKFQTRISWTQILMFIAPFCNSSIEVSPSLSFPWNWSETYTVRVTTRQGRAFRTSLSVPVKPDDVSVRPVCNRSAMDSVLLQTSVGRVLSSGPLPEFHRRYAPVWNSWHSDQCIYRCRDVSDLRFIPLSWLRRKR
jgi:hypothetical protein